MRHFVRVGHYAQHEGPKNNLTLIARHLKGQFHALLGSRGYKAKTRIAHTSSVPVKCAEDYFIVDPYCMKHTREE